MPMNMSGIRLLIPLIFQKSKSPVLASEVLKEKHGICFAKSHLLAALLRCQKIPSGFCYQRLILDDVHYPYLVLHGLNGVYIQEFNQWIRLDARGNEEGGNAQFSLNHEQLAFPVRKELGEENIPIIFANPIDSVINALTSYKNRDEVWRIFLLIFKKSYLCISVSLICILGIRLLPIF